MFVIFVCTMVTLMHLFLWKRLVKDTTTAGRQRRVGTWVLVGLALLVLATLVLGRVLGPQNSGWFAWPGFIWFGLMAYLFITLTVLELPRLAARWWVRREPPADGPAATTSLTTTGPTGTGGGPGAAAAPELVRQPVTPGTSRRLFLARGLAVTAGVASTGLVGAGMVSALGPPELTRHTVPLRGLDPSLAGFRIAVVSDIHLGPLRGRAHTERIVTMINQAQPDLVAVVGDLADGTVDELGPAAEPLRDLVAGQGSFFVTGNHEYFSGYQGWLVELDRLGVHPLRNERTVISRGAGAFELAGVNDLAGDSVNDAPDFDKALGGRDESLPVVLLAHQPVQVSDAAARGVDLQLSGHTHGGQLYPFHHLVRVAQPSLSGLSKVEDTWLYVTRGAGFWGPPVRVGAAPEVSIIELGTASSR